jgi:hypothetical protein
MFFADDDAVAVHTLACAAREIYEKACRKLGLSRVFDLMMASTPGAKETTLWNLLNGPRNFFKHIPEKKPLDLGEHIEFHETMNDFQLLVACCDCASLHSLYPPPVEVAIYLKWFSLIVGPWKPWKHNIEDTVRIDAETERRFASFETLPRDEKKRCGRCLLKLNPVPGAGTKDDIH